jgi:hypothetical protein
MAYSIPDRNNRIHARHQSLIASAPDISPKQLAKVIKILQNDISGPAFTSKEQVLPDGLGNKHHHVASGIELVDFLVTTADVPHAHAVSALDHMLEGDLMTRKGHFGVDDRKKLEYSAVALYRLAGTTPAERERDALDERQYWKRVSRRPSVVLFPGLADEGLVQAVKDADDGKMGPGEHAISAQGMLNARSQTCAEQAGIRQLTLHNVSAVPVHVFVVDNLGRELIVSALRAGERRTFAARVGSAWRARTAYPGDLLLQLHPSGATDCGSAKLHPDSVPHSGGSTLMVPPDGDTVADGESLYEALVGGQRVHESSELALTAHLVPNGDTGTSSVYAGMHCESHPENTALVVILVDISAEMEEEMDTIKTALSGLLAGLVGDHVCIIGVSTTQQLEWGPERMQSTRAMQSAEKYVQQFVCAGEPDFVRAIAARDNVLDLEPAMRDYHPHTSVLITRTRCAETILRTELARVLEDRGLPDISVAPPAADPAIAGLPPTGSALHSVVVGNDASRIGQDNLRYMAQRTGGYVNFTADTNPSVLAMQLGMVIGGARLTAMRDLRLCISLPTHTALVMELIPGSDLERMVEAKAEATAVRALAREALRALATQGKLRVLFPNGVYYQIATRYATTVGEYKLVVLAATGLRVASFFTESDEEELDDCATITDFAGGTELVATLESETVPATDMSELEPELTTATTGTLAGTGQAACILSPSCVLALYRLHAGTIAIPRTLVIMFENGQQYSVAVGAATTVGDFKQVVRNITGKHVGTLFYQAEFSMLEDSRDIGDLPSRAALMATEAEPKESQFVVAFAGDAASKFATDSVTPTTYEKAATPTTYEKAAATMNIQTPLTVGVGLATTVGEYKQVLSSSTGRMVATLCFDDLVLDNSIPVAEIPSGTRLVATEVAAPIAVADPAMDGCIELDRVPFAVEAALQEGQRLPPVFVTKQTSAEDPELADSLIWPVASSAIATGTAQVAERFATIVNYGEVSAGQANDVSGTVHFPARVAPWYGKWDDVTLPPIQTTVNRDSRQPGPSGLPPGPPERPGPPGPSGPSGLQRSPGALLGPPGGASEFPETPVQPPQLQNDDAAIWRPMALPPQVLVWASFWSVSSHSRQAASRSLCAEWSSGAAANARDDADAAAMASANAASAIATATHVEERTNSTTGAPPWLAQNMPLKQQMQYVHEQRLKVEDAMQKTQQDEVTALLAQCPVMLQTFDPSFVASLRKHGVQRETEKTSEKLEVASTQQRRQRRKEQEAAAARRRAEDQRRDHLHAQMQHLHEQVRFLVAGNGGAATTASKLNETAEAAHQAEMERVADPDHSDSKFSDGLEGSEVIRLVAQRTAEQHAVNDAALRALDAAENDTNTKLQIAQATAGAEEESFNEEEVEMTDRQLRAQTALHDQLVAAVDAKHAGQDLSAGAHAELRRCRVHLRSVQHQHKQNVVQDDRQEGGVFTIPGGADAVGAVEAASKATQDADAAAAIAAHSERDAQALFKYSLRAQERVHAVETAALSRRCELAAVAAQRRHADLVAAGSALRRLALISADANRSERAACAAVDAAAARMHDCWASAALAEAKAACSPKASATLAVDRIADEAVAARVAEAFGATINGNDSSDSDGDENTATATDAAGQMNHGLTDPTGTRTWVSMLMAPPTGESDCNGEEELPSARAAAELDHQLSKLYASRRTLAGRVGALCERARNRLCAAAASEARDVVNAQNAVQVASVTRALSADAVAAGLAGLEQLAAMHESQSAEAAKLRLQEERAQKAARRAMRGNEGDRQSQATSQQAFLARVRQSKAEQARRTTEATAEATRSLRVAQSELATAEEEERQRIRDITDLIPDHECAAQVRAEEAQALVSQAARLLTPTGPTGRAASSALLAWKTWETVDERRQHFLGDTHVACKTAEAACLALERAHAMFKRRARAAAAAALVPGAGAPAPIQPGTAGHDRDGSGKIGPDPYRGGGGGTATHRVDPSDRSEDSIGAINDVSCADGSTAGGVIPHTAAPRRLTSAEAVAREDAIVAQTAAAAAASDLAVALDTAVEAAAKAEDTASITEFETALVAQLRERATAANAHAVMELRAQQNQLGELNQGACNAEAVWRAYREDTLLRKRQLLATSHDLQEAQRLHAMAEVTENVRLDQVHAAEDANATARCASLGHVLVPLAAEWLESAQAAAKKAAANTLDASSLVKGKQAEFKDAEARLGADAIRDDLAWARARAHKVAWVLLCARQCMRVSEWVLCDWSMSGCSAFTCNVSILADRDLRQAARVRNPGAQLHLEEATASLVRAHVAASSAGTRLEQVKLELRLAQAAQTELHKQIRFEKDQKAVIECRLAAGETEIALQQQLNRLPKTRQSDDSASAVATALLDLRNQLDLQVIGNRARYFGFKGKGQSVRGNLAMANARASVASSTFNELGERSRELRQTLSGIAGDAAHAGFTIAARFALELRGRPKRWQADVVAKQRAATRLQAAARGRLNRFDMQDKLRLEAEVAKDKTGRLRLQQNLHKQELLQTRQRELERIQRRQQQQREGARNVWDYGPGPRVRHHLDKLTERDANVSGLSLEDGGLFAALSATHTAWSDVAKSTGEGIKVAGVMGELELHAAANALDAGQITRELLHQEEVAHFQAMAAELDAETHRCQVHEGQLQLMLRNGGGAQASEDALIAFSVAGKDAADQNIKAEHSAEGHRQPVFVPGPAGPDMNLPNSIDDIDAQRKRGAAVAERIDRAKRREERQEVRRRRGLRVQDRKTEDEATAAREKAMFSAEKKAKKTRLSFFGVVWATVLIAQLKRASYRVRMARHELQSKQLFNRLRAHTVQRRMSARSLGVVAYAMHFVAHLLRARRRALARRGLLELQNFAEDERVQAIYDLRYACVRQMREIISLADVGRLPDAIFACDGLLLQAVTHPLASCCINGALLPVLLRFHGYIAAAKYMGKKEARALLKQERRSSVEAAAAASIAQAEDPPEREQVCSAHVSAAPPISPTPTSPPPASPPRTGPQSEESTPRDVALRKAAWAKDQHRLAALMLMQSVELQRALDVRQFPNFCTHEQKKAVADFCERLAAKQGTPPVPICPVLVNETGYSVTVVWAASRYAANKSSSRRISISTASKPKTTKGIVPNLKEGQKQRRTTMLRAFIGTSPAKRESKSTESPVRAKSLKSTVTTEAIRETHYRLEMLASVVPDKVDWTSAPVHAEVFRKDFTSLGGVASVSERKKSKIGDNLRSAISGERKRSRVPKAVEDQSKAVEQTAARVLATENIGQWVTVYEGNRCSHAVSGMHPGTTYRFRVIAFYLDTAVGALGDLSEVDLQAPVAKIPLSAPSTPTGMTRGLSAGFSAKEQWKTVRREVKQRHAERKKGKKGTAKTLSALFNSGMAVGGSESVDKTDLSKQGSLTKFSLTLGKLGSTKSFLSGKSSLVKEDVPTESEPSPEVTLTTPLPATELLEMSLGDLHRFVAPGTRVPATARAGCGGAVLGHDSDMADIKSGKEQKEWPQEWDGCGQSSVAGTALLVHWPVPVADLYRMLPLPPHAIDRRKPPRFEFFIDNGLNREALPPTEHAWRRIPGEVHLLYPDGPVPVSKAVLESTAGTSVDVADENVQDRPMSTPLKSRVKRRPSFLTPKADRGVNSGDIDDGCDNLGPTQVHNHTEPAKVGAATDGSSGINNAGDVTAQSASGTRVAAASVSRLRKISRTPTSSKPTVERPDIKPFGHDCVPESGVYLAVPPNFIERSRSYRIMARIWVDVLRTGGEAAEENSETDASTGTETSAAQQSRAKRRPSLLHSDSLRSLISKVETSEPIAMPRPLALALPSEWSAPGYYLSPLAPVHFDRSHSSSLDQATGTSHLGLCWEPFPRTATAWQGMQSQGMGSDRHSNLHFSTGHVHDRNIAWPTFTVKLENSAPDSRLVASGPPSVRRESSAEVLAQQREQRDLTEEESLLRAMERQRKYDQQKHKPSMVPRRKSFSEQGSHSVLDAHSHWHPEVVAEHGIPQTKKACVREPYVGTSFGTEITVTSGEQLTASLCLSVTFPSAPDGKPCTITRTAPAAALAGSLASLQVAGAGTSVVLVWAKVTDCRYIVQQRCIMSREAQKDSLHEQWSSPVIIASGCPGNVLEVEQLRTNARHSFRHAIDTSTATPEEALDTSNCNFSPWVVHDTSMPALAVMALPPQVVMRPEKSALKDCGEQAASLVAANKWMNMAQKKPAGLGVASYDERANASGQQSTEQFEPQYVKDAAHGSSNHVIQATRWPVQCKWEDPIAGRVKRFSRAASQRRIRGSLGSLTQSGVKARRASDGPNSDGPTTDDKTSEGSLTVPVPHLTSRYQLQLLVPHVDCDPRSGMWQPLYDGAQQKLAVDLLPMHSPCFFRVAFTAVNMDHSQHGDTQLARRGSFVHKRKLTPGNPALAMTAMRELELHAFKQTASLDADVSLSVSDRRGGKGWDYSEPMVSFTSIVAPQLYRQLTTLTESPEVAAAYDFSRRGSVMGNAENEHKEALQASEEHNGPATEPFTVVEFYPFQGVQSAAAGISTGVSAIMYPLTENWDVHHELFIDDGSGSKEPLPANPAVGTPWPVDVPQTGVWRRLLRQTGDQPVARANRNRTGSLLHRIPDEELVPGCKYRVALRVVVSAQGTEADSALSQKPLSADMAFAEVADELPSNAKPVSAMRRAPAQKTTHSRECRTYSVVLFAGNSTFTDFTHRPLVPLLFSGIGRMVTVSWAVRGHNRASMKLRTGASALEAAVLSSDKATRPNTSDVVEGKSEIFHLEYCEEKAGHEGEWGRIHQCLVRGRAWEPTAAALRSGTRYRFRYAVAHALPNENDLALFATTLAPSAAMSKGTESDSDSDGDDAAGPGGVARAAAIEQIKASQLMAKSLIKWSDWAEHETTVPAPKIDAKGVDNKEEGCASNWVMVSWKACARCAEAMRDQNLVMPPLFHGDQPTGKKVSLAAMQDLCYILEVLVPKATGNWSPVPAEATCTGERPLPNQWHNEWLPAASSTTSPSVESDGHWRTVYAGNKTATVVSGLPSNAAVFFRVSVARSRRHWDEFCMARAGSADQWLQQGKQMQQRCMVLQAHQQSVAPWCHYGSMHAERGSAGLLNALDPPLGADEESSPTGSETDQRLEERRRIQLNVDTSPPTGHLTSPLVPVVLTHTVDGSGSDELHHRVEFPPICGVDCVTLGALARNCRPQNLPLGLTESHASLSSYVQRDGHDFHEADVHLGAAGGWKATYELHIDPVNEAAAEAAEAAGTKLPALAKEGEYSVQSAAFTANGKGVLLHHLAREMPSCLTPGQFHFAAGKRYSVRTRVVVSHSGEPASNLVTFSAPVVFTPIPLKPLGVAGVGRSLTLIVPAAGETAPMLQGRVHPFSLVQGDTSDAPATVFSLHAAGDGATSVSDSMTVTSTKQTHDQDGPAVEYELQLQANSQYAFRYAYVKDAMCEGPASEVGWSDWHHHQTCVPKPSWQLLPFDGTVGRSLEANWPSIEGDEQLSCTWYELQLCIDGADTSSAWRTVHAGDLHSRTCRIDGLAHNALCALRVLARRIPSPAGLHEQEVERQRLQQRRVHRRHRGQRADGGGARTQQDVDEEAEEDAVLNQPPSAAWDTCGHSPSVSVLTPLSPLERAAVTIKHHTSSPSGGAGKSLKSTGKMASKDHTGSVVVQWPVPTAPCMRAVLADLDAPSDRSTRLTSAETPDGLQIKLCVHSAERLGADERLDALLPAKEDLELEPELTAAVTGEWELQPRLVKGSSGDGQMAQVRMLQSRFVCGVVYSFNVHVHLPRYSEAGGAVPSCKASSEVHVLPRPPRAILVSATATTAQLDIDEVSDIGSRGSARRYIVMVSGQHGTHEGASVPAASVSGPTTVTVRGLQPCSEQSLQVLLQVTPVVPVGQQPQDLQHLVVGMPDMMESQPIGSQRFECGPPVIVVTAPAPPALIAATCTSLAVGWCPARAFHRAPATPVSAPELALRQRDHQFVDHGRDVNAVFQVELFDGSFGRWYPVYKGPCPQAGKTDGVPASQISAGMGVVDLRQAGRLRPSATPPHAKELDCDTWYAVRVRCWAHDQPPTCSEPLVALTAPAAPTVLNKAPGMITLEWAKPKVHQLPVGCKPAPAVDLRATSDAPRAGNSVMPASSTVRPTAVQYMLQMCAAPSSPKASLREDGGEWRAVCSGVDIQEGTAHGLCGNTPLCFRLRTSRRKSELGFGEAEGEVMSFSPVVRVVSALNVPRAPTGLAAAVVGSEASTGKIRPVLQVGT